MEIKTVRTFFLFFFSKGDVIAESSSAFLWELQRGSFLSCLFIIARLGCCFQQNTARCNAILTDRTQCFLWRNNENALHISRRAWFKCLEVCKFLVNADKGIIAVVKDGIHLFIDLDVFCNRLYDAVALQKFINSGKVLDVYKRQLKNMGSMQDVLAMMPGGNKLSAAAVDEKALARTEAIVKSMTMKERKNPSVINGSRRKRIAAGSGTTIQDVNIFSSCVIQLI